MWTSDKCMGNNTLYVTIRLTSSPIAISNLEEFDFNFEANNGVAVFVTKGPDCRCIHLE